MGAGNRVTKDVLMSEESMYLTPWEGVLNLGVVWCRACKKWITGVLAVPSGEILAYQGCRNLRSFPCVYVCVCVGTVYPSEPLWFCEFGGSQLIPCVLRIVLCRVGRYPETTLLPP